MLENKKILLTILLVLILLIIPNLVLAEGELFATTEINGVTANWQYYLNESNEIEELICTNISDLTGNIVIPSSIDGNNVVSLGFKAFYGSTSITEVTLPNTLKNVGGYAFAGCTKLAKINFGTGVQYLSINAFENCTALTSLSIPKSLTKDCGNHPFAGCSNITSVTFEDGITQIPGFLCQDLTGITEITIPNSATKIGVHAFSGCTKLAKINFGTGVQYLSINAFENCTALTSLSIPKSLTKDCGNHPFAGCSNITSVTFEDGITQIPGFLCQDLTGITEITIPNSATKIGGYAFAGCTFLKKITILDNVAYIGVNTFENHNNYLTIYCYKDSEAAKYAIENDIKYVYLTRPEASALKEIVIEKVANKVDYKVGEKFDKTGMIVKAVYEDGTSKQIENYSINPNTALKLSDTKVTISYTENGVTKEATHKIRVINSSGKVENIDNTTAPGEMPYTGGTFFIILTVIGIATVAIYVYKRNNDLRGI